MVVPVPVLLIVFVLVPVLVFEFVIVFVIVVVFVLMLVCLLVCLLVLPFPFPFPCRGTFACHTTCGCRAVLSHVFMMSGWRRACVYESSRASQASEASFMHGLYYESCQRPTFQKLTNHQ